MPRSFRDALGQAGFCCGGSGTDLQKAAACKSKSCDLLAIDLQQSSANIHYQTLQSPQTQFFRGRHPKTDLIATGGCGVQKPAAIPTGKYAASRKGDH